MSRWIVVGGGAAGCVVAGRLSADPRNEVVLVEAGADHGADPHPGDRGPLFDDPMRLAVFDVRRRGTPDVESPEADSDAGGRDPAESRVARLRAGERDGAGAYAAERHVAESNLAEPEAAESHSGGSQVGGSQVGESQAGGADAADSDLVEAYAADSDLAEAYAVESYLVGRGLGGSSLVNGAVVVADGPGGDGVGHAIPLSDPDPVGPVGAALLGCDPRAALLRLTASSGRRVTAADAYLRPALVRPNLTVSTVTTVERVRFRGRRAVGVVTADATSIDGDRVVVCAGAIATPVLLLRSGVVAAGLGEHLHDHPAVAFTLSVGDAFAGHAITVAITTRDHQLLALERTGADDGHGALLVGLTNVTSRGRVALDADGAPLVELGQLATAHDRARIVTAVRDAVDVLARPPMRAVAAQIAIDDAGTPIDRLGASRADVERWVLDRLGGFHHVAGTCRRGVVTDDGGWVRGYDGLAVADASLFVDAPRSNIYLATILQAEQLVRRWSVAER